MQGDSLYKSLKTITVCGEYMRLVPPTAGERPLSERHASSHRGGARNDAVQGHNGFPDGMHHVRRVQNTQNGSRICGAGARSTDRGRPHSETAASAAAVLTRPFQSDPQTRMMNKFFCGRLQIDSPSGLHAKKKF